MDLIVEIYVHLLFRWPCLKEPSPLQYRSSDVTAIARYPLSKFVVHAVHFVQDISPASLLNFECIVWHINCYASFIYFALGVAINWNILYGNVKFLQNIILYRTCAHSSLIMSINQSHCWKFFSPRNLSYFNYPKKYSKSWVIDDYRGS